MYVHTYIYIYPFVYSCGAYYSYYYYYTWLERSNSFMAFFVTLPWPSSHVVAFFPFARDCWYVYVNIHISYYEYHDVGVIFMSVLFFVQNKNTIRVDRRRESMVSLDVDELPSEAPFFASSFFLNFEGRGPVRICLNGLDDVRASFNSCFNRSNSLDRDGSSSLFSPVV